MNNHELFSSFDRQMYVPEGLAEELPDFWRSWGPHISQVRMQLPDFANKDWQFQHVPTDTEGDIHDALFRVTGEAVCVPYFTYDKHRIDGRDMLYDLVSAAAAADYGIIVDVGSSDSLAPLTVAGRYEKTIVIGLDPFVGPHEMYPDKIPWFLSYSDEYPFVARAIVSNQMKRSGAFFFPFHIEDADVQGILRDQAWRVQVVAPDPEVQEGKTMLQIVSASSHLVAPGGEMIVTGDTITNGAITMNMRFRSATHRRDGQLFPLVHALEQSFNSFHTHPLSGADLYRLYGIADSKWFATVHPYFAKAQDNLGVMPGVAIFGDKRASV